MSRYIRLNIVLELEECSVFRFNPGEQEVDENGKIKEMKIPEGITLLDVKMVPHMTTVEQISEAEVEESVNKS
jgi:hypothetical protein